MRPDMFQWTPDDAPGKIPPFVPMMEVLRNNILAVVENWMEQSSASFASRWGPISSAPELQTNDIRGVVVNEFT